MSVGQAHPFHRTFAAKGKRSLEAFANKPIFLNGLTLEFRGFEAKIFVECVLCAVSIRSMSLSHF